MKYQISKLKYSTQFKNFIELWINGETVILLPLDLVIRLNLYQGKNLTEEDLACIEKEGVDLKLFKRIAKWLQIRPRSCGEFLDYAKFRLQLSSDQAKSLLNFLEKNHLVDDETFAAWYVKNRVEHKFYGKKKIFFELVRKGVDTVIINDALAKFYQDTFEVSKILNFMKKLSSDFDKNKLTQKLLGLGFDYKNIKKAIKIYENRVC